MKKIRKYFSVFHTSFKQSKDVVVDILFGSICFLIFMYVFIQLWGYIYKKDTSSLINGYSLGQMIWYLIIAELITSVSKTNHFTKTISNEVKTGNISYKLNKPYNYYFYQITSFMGNSVFQLLFYVPIALIIGFIFIGNIPSFTWTQIIPCLIVIILSILVNLTLFAIVGLISFWIQDSTPFVWIIKKFLMIFGLFFPLEFFPLKLQPFIKYSPVYSIMSGPSSLVANFSWNLFLQVSLSQVFWIIIFVIIGLLTYHFGKRKVVSNGG